MIKNLTADKPGRRNRPRIAADAAELIGNTPLVRLSSFAEGATGHAGRQAGSFTPALPSRTASASR